MITTYHGEFLTCPIPLEMSGNLCSHSCVFCYANLGQPNRKMDTKRILNLLSDLQNRNTLEANLLKAKYPICISNKSDPFSGSNFTQTLPILETLTALDIPVQFQTRGGRGVNEALDIVKPSVWYISINTATEDLRRQLEPAAPSIVSRFELIETLVSRGHRVVLGLNPCVPEWMPDPEPILSRAFAAGASGAWIARLHLNKNQVANMSDKDRDAIGPELIARAQKRKLPDEDRAVIFRAYEACIDLGMPFFSFGQPFRSEFFAPYHETYLGKTFPTLQDWINHLWDEPDSEERVITFDEFADFFCSRMPAGVLPIDSYLGALGSVDLYRKMRIPTQMTYRQLLSIMWRTPKTQQCPAKFPSFAYAGYRDTSGDGNGWVQVCDENEMPYMLFSREGFTDYWAPVEIGKAA